MFPSQAPLFQHCIKIPLEADSQGLTLPAGKKGYHRRVPLNCITSLRNNQLSNHMYCEELFSHQSNALIHFPGGNCSQSLLNIFLIDSRRHNV